MDQHTVQERNTGIDAVKAAAIIGVVLLHVSTEAYSLPIGSFNWLSAVFWGCLVRASVPLFFMCSGALMLNPDKELPIRRLYGKNILKIVVAMLVWATVYKAYHLHLLGSLTPRVLWHSFKEVLLFKQEFHLYYLHIILLVYAFLPVTRVFVRHASEKGMRYALLLWFALGILYPTLRPYWPLSLVSGIPEQWLMNMSYAAIGYGLLGYWLRRRLPSLRASALIAAVGFLMVFVPTVALSKKSGAMDQRFLEGMTVGVCVYAVGLYSLLYRWGKHLASRERLCAAVTGLSRASFCIYLVHVLFLTHFELHQITAGRFLPLISIPVLAAAIIVLSLLCYVLFSIIPVVRKWLI